jgi:hypothetical protein
VQQQKIVPTYTIDIRTPGKMEEFKEERKFKIVERIAPYCNEDQKKDLTWSIDGIKKTYDAKIDAMKLAHKKELDKASKHSITDSKKKDI